MCELVASLGNTVFHDNRINPFLMDDYYVEPDEVERGVTITPCEDEEEIANIDNQKVVHAEGDAKEERLFSSTDIAPELSQDVAEYLSLTAVRLCDCAPFTVANNVISFFESVVISRISKVNRKKFAIKADVIVSGTHCETKVRIYHEGAACTVEFQKRTGCTRAFNKMFSLAKVFLLCNGIVQADAIASLQEDVSIASPHDNTLTPLFNIIERSRNDDVIAEAASSLAEAVKAPEIAAHMHKPCALSALRQLQQVRDFRISYPTSQVMTWCAAA
jgi:hypothetical protein